MKWLNKKNSRKGWVEVAAYDLSTLSLRDILDRMQQGEDIITVDYLKNWCRKHESDGKFFYSWNTGRWYFEKEQDAIIFKLKFT